MLNCDVTESDDTVTLRLSGQIDRYAGVDRILVTMEPYLSADGVEEVVLDLTEVDSLDAHIKSALPGLKLEAKARGKVLSIVESRADRDRTSRTDGLSRRLRI